MRFCITKYRQLHVPRCAHIVELEAAVVTLPQQVALSLLQLQHARRQLHVQRVGALQLALVMLAYVLRVT